MEPSCSQTADSTSKPKAMSIFSLQKLKGTKPARIPALWVAHLEEESADKEEGAESEDPDGIKVITKEFIVHPARTVKDAQQEEKCCYQCSSLKHFIHDCPLVKASRMDPPLNQRRGQHQRSDLGPSRKGNHAEGTPRWDTQCIGHHTQTPFLNPNPFY